MPRNIRLPMEIYLLYKFPPELNLEKATDIIGKCISTDAIKDLEIIRTKPTVRPQKSACLLKAPKGLEEQLQTITHHKDKISVASGFRDCLKTAERLGFKTTEAIIDKFTLYDDPSKQNISMKVRVDKKLSHALESHSKSKTAEDGKNMKSGDEQASSEQASSEQASSSSDYDEAKKEYLKFIKEKKEVISKAHSLKKEYRKQIHEQDEIIEAAKFEIDVAEINFKIKKLEL